MRHRADPTPPVRGERFLVLAACALTLLAVPVGGIVLPIQAADHRTRELAEEIVSNGTAPVRALGVEQEVGYTRGWVVEGLRAEYRADDGGTRTARLHGYDQGAVVAEHSGRYLVPDSAGALVRVTPDGREGFLEEDLRATLAGEFDGLYAVVDLWLASCVVTATAGLAVRARRQIRAGARTRRALRPPAVYLVGAIAGALACYLLGSWFAATS